MQFKSTCLFLIVFAFDQFILNAQVVATGSLMTDKALSGETLVFNSDSTIVFGYEATSEDKKAGVTYAVRRYNLNSLQTESEKTILLPGHISSIYVENGSTYFVGRSSLSGKNELFRVKHAENDEKVTPVTFGEIPEPYVYLKFHWYSPEKKQHYCVFTSDVNVKGKTAIAVATFDQDLKQTDKQEINLPEFAKGIFLFDAVLDEKKGWLSLLLAPIDKLKEHTNMARGASTFAIYTYKGLGNNSVTMFDMGKTFLASPLLLLDFSKGPFLTGLNKTDDTNEIIMVFLSNELDKVIEKKNTSVILPEGSFEYNFISQVTLNHDSSLCYLVASTFLTPKCVILLEKNFTYRWSQPLPDMPMTNFALAPVILSVLEVVEGTDSISMIYYHHRTLTENTSWIDNADGLHNIKDKSFPLVSISILNIDLKTGNGHLRYNVKPDSDVPNIGIAQIVYSSEELIIARAILSDRKKNSSQLFSVKR